MKTRMVFGCITMFLFLTTTVFSGGKGELQKYFNDAANKVKATNSASEKRIILNESFHTMSKALERIESSGLVSKNDIAGIVRYKSALKEKQDELAGLNGYVRISDDQLNDFSDYVVQDMEQADAVITISVVTLLLIIILVVLIAK